MFRLSINLLLFLPCLFVFGQRNPEILKETDFSIGKTLQIESSVLGESRILNIYLPMGYEADSLKEYPVIYLLDGSADEDFIHIAGLVQFASFAWVNLIPESIVVGIGNVDRKRDFTFPSSNKLDLEEFPSSGQSENFIEFIAMELQPFIDSHFRTKNTSTLIGQSLGGLLATEILIERADLFDRYIIVSPSLWWSNEQLLKEDSISCPEDKSIYIAVGKEGEVMERLAKELYEKLVTNKTENSELYFEFMKEKTHGDALHNAVYKAFETFEQSNNK